MVISLTILITADQIKIAFQWSYCTSSLVNIHPYLYMYINLNVLLSCRKKKESVPPFHTEFDTDHDSMKSIQF